MNPPSDKRVLPELEEFANQVGEFMDYWGFKKIHGQIWSHIYLAKHPIDAQELIRRLHISKALVSISLRELIEFGVILEAGKSERGTRLYKACEDLVGTIMDTLRRRERKMLARIQAAHSLLEKLDEDDFSEHEIERDRVKNLGALIRLADLGLDQLIKKQDGSVQDFLKFLAISQTIAKNSLGNIDHSKGESHL